MTKEKLSLLEFTSKVNDYMHKKACEVGFVFTMENSSGNEWYLHTRELNECNSYHSLCCTIFTVPCSHQSTIQVLSKGK